MSPLDVFRQDFAGLMHACAEDRRRTVRGGRASGEDLKIIALFDRLARQAEDLDERVFSSCQEMLGREPLARCLLNHRADLLQQVGVLYWPRHAADLVDWMTLQATAAMPVDCAARAASGVSAPSQWQRPTPA